MSMRLFYAQSKADQQTTDTGDWAYIAGLELTLPQATDDATFAVVTLNVPNPYAKGNDYPGCNFAIAAEVSAKVRRLSPTCCFTSSNKVADPAGPISAGRVPVTVVGKVMLDKEKRIGVYGQWQSVRGATAVIDSPVSLSAVTGRG